MLCPFCKIERSSRFYKPSQWRSYSAVTEYFNCCKECNPDCYKARLDMDALRAEMIRMLRWWNGPPKAHFVQFMEHWISLGKVQLKKLSHYGGIWNAELKQYEDIGNDVGCDFMLTRCPEFLHSHSYSNSEHIMDLLESILRYAYLYNAWHVPVIRFLVHFAWSFKLYVWGTGCDAESLRRDLLEHQ